MKEEFNLFEVTKKTSFADVVVMLNSIENKSRCFKYLANRRWFIIGCLTACGFTFNENFASRFSNVCNISRDNKVYRLPFSCSGGKWRSIHCFDVDISIFK